MAFFNQIGGVKKMKNFKTWSLIFTIILSFSISALANNEVPLKVTKIIKYQGAKIAVYESSGKKGPGILLLHGNTSSANSYAKIMRSPFAKQYRVVAVDLPGYGRSSRLSGYNVAIFKKTIATVAKVTKTDKGVLVGWSLGGDLAIQATQVLPKLKGLLIFGTAPIGGAPANSPSGFLEPHESYAGIATQYGAVQDLSKAQIQDYVDAFFAPYYRHVPHMFYNDGYKTDPMTRTSVAMAVLGMDSTFTPEVPILRKLKIPVAIVHAQKDAFVRYAYLKSLEKVIPSLWTGRVIVAHHSGHAIHWERPVYFNSILRTFVLSL